MVSMVLHHTPIQVLIADDTEVYREGLQSVLKGYTTDVTVVGEARDAQETVQKAHALRPDLILLDLRMPPNHSDLYNLSSKYGVAVIWRIQASLPSVRILVVSGALEGSPLLFDALRAGACGYIHKDDNFGPSSLVDAMRRTMRGEAIFGPAVMPYFQRYHAQNGAFSDVEHLTDREHDVLNLLVQRKSNPEIAEHLVISVPTVKTHVSNILKKTQLRSREEIPHRYYYLIPPEPSPQ